MSNDGVGVRGGENDREREREGLEEITRVTVAGEGDFYKSSQTHGGAEIQQSDLETPALILNAASQLFLTPGDTWEGIDPHYSPTSSALPLIIHTS